MNIYKVFECTSRSERLCWILVILTTAFFITSKAEQYSNSCRSIHGKFGTCVPLATCPLFYGWLRQRPLVKENLRLLVKYTCYFDIKNPKVCCPNDNLYISQDEDDTIGVRLATPIRRAVGPHAPNTGNKLLFPDTLQTSTATSKQQNAQKELVTTSSEGKRDPTPLSFPTERYSHAQHSQHERGSVWDGAVKGNKDPSIAKKDLRHHSNFKLIPKLHECSSAVKLDSLIDGTYGAYPWLALVGIKRKRSLDFDHVCSGVIINNRYILTVAHCFDRGNPRIQTVRLGEYNLDTLIDQGSEYLPQSTRVDYRIEKLTLHPGYNQETGANDIALIRVDRPIALNTTFIRSACLPFVMEYGIENRLDVNSVSDVVGKPGWVAGWSRHSWDGIYSTGSGSDISILGESIVDFTSHDKCIRDYPHLSQFSSRTQLCVGGKGRRNSCISDSGGPLMLPIKVPSKIEGFMEPKFFMVGLLSRGPTGSSCQIVDDGGKEDEESKHMASRALPTSVYTRISKYLSWILDNMQE